MASAALIIERPVSATPVVQSVPPLPANDAIRCWTEDPRAKRLLDSCVALPPVGRWHEQRYTRSVDRYWSYVGYRFEALEAIRDEIGAELLLAYHAHGDAAYAPFAAYCRQPSVNDAIDAALNRTLDTVREG